MNLQEREHWDHEAGCHCPHQNALALSRAAAPSGDVELIKKLIDEGKFPVCISWEWNCPATDAYIKDLEFLVVWFNTLEEAKAHVDNDTTNPYYIPRECLDEDFQASLGELSHALQMELDVPF